MFHVSVTSVKCIFNTISEQAKYIDIVAYGANHAQSKKYDQYQYKNNLN